MHFGADATVTGPTQPSATAIIFLPVSVTECMHVVITTRCSTHEATCACLGVDRVALDHVDEPYLTSSLSPLSLALWIEMTATRQTMPSSLP